MTPAQHIAEKQALRGIIRRIAATIDRREPGTAAKVEAELRAIHEKAKTKER